MLGRCIEIVLPATLSPRFVITGEILLEHQLAMTDDNHGVNVGFGFLQPAAMPQSRTLSRPTLSGELIVHPSPRAAGTPQAGLVWLGA